MFDEVEAPVGRWTRLISPMAAVASGMVQSVQVHKTGVRRTVLDRELLAVQADEVDRHIGLV